jgi:hypothetical protein
MNRATISIDARMASSGMLRRVALVRTDVPEEPSASFFRVTRIGELGTTPAVTSNRRTLTRATQRNIPEDTILQLLGYQLRDCPRILHVTALKLFIMLRVVMFPNVAPCGLYMN